MSRRERIEAALVGAYVADASALGFHWLYDPDRIAALSGDSPVFRQPDAADFDGFQGVFVHTGRQAGDLSQYGAQLRVAIQSMLATDGAFDVADFQDRFAVTFGVGGSWDGYIDKATKATLENLAAGQRDPSGGDDDQVPAIARFPAVMAASGVASEDIDAIIAITSANETAAAWAPAAAALLKAAYDGMTPREAALSVAKKTEGEIGAALMGAVRSSEADTVAFAGTVGRACPLPQAMPVIFHICARSRSYKDAIERNILVGGDNCGRAPVLGAVFGAAKGFGGQGVPSDWVARVTNIGELRAESDALAKKTA